MSKLWGAVQSGAGPIGGVLPMDAESSVFKFRCVTVFNAARCRVGARHDENDVLLAKFSHYIVT